MGPGPCGRRPSLGSVNPSLSCALCKGYLVNAMTLVRCMHSFCKSCINRHLDTSSACPTCQQRVFRSRMDLHMVADSTLQSVVYKTVPGLYVNEMRRRRDFYESREEPTEAVAEKLACGEERGFPSCNIFTEDDSISLILEHRQDEPGSIKLCDRHLSCPAEVPVWVVIKFIRNKFSPPASLAIHIHLEKADINKLKKNSKRGTKDSDEPTADNDRLILDPDLTLIDVCYIADYKFDAPLKLSFSFVQPDPTYSRQVHYESSATPVQQRKQTAIPRNGVSTTSSSPFKNSTVDYAKYKVDTKCIDMARCALLNGGVKNSSNSSCSVSGPLSAAAKNRTYSRAAGGTVSAMPLQLGQISHLKPLPLTTALSSCHNEATGDSTEEEEADNWDSNVSTTIDRTLTTQQHQQQSNPLNHSASNHPPINGNASGCSQAYSLSRPLRTTSASTPAHALGSAKHSKVPALPAFSSQPPTQNLKGDSTIRYDERNSPIVSRPQSLKVNAQPGQAQPMQQLQVSSLDNKVAPSLMNKQPTPPIVQQPGPARLSKPGQSHRGSHKPSTAVEYHHGSHKAKSVAAPIVSPTSASASIVEGKPPTVLKIKLNTSPTTSETLTITSPPPARDQRQSSAEKAATLSNSASPAGTSPKANKEFPLVTSIKIKPLVAPSGPVTRKTPSPPVNARDSRAAALDARKKRKLEEEARKLDEQKAKKGKRKTSSQAAINETPFVPVQHKDLLTTQSFGWGSAAILWESQLRIPSPLIVPFTVSFARRQRKCMKETQTKSPPVHHSTKRLRSTQAINSQDAFLEANFGLRKQPLAVKEPQNRIWRKRRQVSPPPVQVKLPPPDFVISPTLENILQAIAADKVVDVETPAPQTTPVGSNQRDSPPVSPASEHFLDTAHPKPSSNNDVNADVFRMEFPGARGADDSTNPETPVERVPQVVLSHQVPPERRPSSSSEVKFSISSILSNDLGQKKPVPAKQECDRQPNVQEIVEAYLANMSKFFWSLESSEPNVRSSLQTACADKKLVLIKILAILRNISLAVVPAESDKVLELAALIQRHLLASDSARSVGIPKVPTDSSDTQSSSEGDSAKKDRRFYDVNRNQLPFDGVPSCAEQKMTPPEVVSESPGTSISAGATSHISLPCPPAAVHQISGHMSQRKPFQMQEILVKEVAAALKKMPPNGQEQKSAFELVTIKRSSSVSSLNTSDGSENFADSEIEPNRWEDVEVIPPPRPWPGCPSEV